jgi:hypothetical protein
MEAYAMLKKVLLAAVAIGFVGAFALPMQVVEAEAATSCREAAKVKFPGDRKARHAYKKACKAAMKAQQA